MECKRRKNLDVEDDAPTLYYLLSSSGKVSERTVSIILEQVWPLYEVLILHFNLNGI